MEHIYTIIHVFYFNWLIEFQHIKHNRDSHAKLHQEVLFIFQDGCLVMNKSECHALFISLLLLWWLDAMQSHDCWPHTSSGMPEMILKLASTIWLSKGQAKAEDKYHILATTKRLKVNLGASLTYFCLCHLCLRSIYFLYDFEQIFLLKSHIKKTTNPPLPWKKKVWVKTLDWTSK